AEGWTLLAALAASTARLTLGTLVTPTVFRHPALLAKMAAGVDGISGGRLVLGLGAGVAGAEYRMYGIAAGDRWARFEEELQIIVGLLGGTPVTWSGRFHQLRDAPLRPAPAPPGPGVVGRAGQRTTRPARRRMDDRLVRAARRPAARAPGRDGAHPGRTGPRPGDAAPHGRRRGSRPRAAAGPPGRADPGARGPGRRARRVPAAGHRRP